MFKHRFYPLRYAADIGAALKVLYERLVISLLIPVAGGGAPTTARQPISDERLFHRISILRQAKRKAGRFRSIAEGSGRY